MKGIYQLKEIDHLIKEISIVRDPIVYDLFLLYYILELHPVLLVCSLEKRSTYMDLGEVSMH